VLAEAARRNAHISKLRAVLPPRAHVDQQDSLPAGEGEQASKLGTTIS
jgi:hypothetical protein